MVGRNIETLLSYHCLTGKHLNTYSFNIIFFSCDLYITEISLLIGPLLKNLVSEYDKAINKLQVKYRTYIIEYDFETVSILSFSLYYNNIFFGLVKLMSAAEKNKKYFSG